MGKGKKGKKGKKDNSSAFDLDKYLNKVVHVRFAGGREVRGVLKGWDAPSNLVLDEVQEFLRDERDATKIVLDKTRPLGAGLVVCRGTSVCLVGPPGSPVDAEELAGLQALGDET